MPLTPASSRRRLSSRLLAAGLPLACLALAVACGEGATEPPVEAEPTRLVNEELGFAVVVPPGSPFEPAGVEGDEIRLRFPGDAEFTGGTVIYTAEPEQYFGVNLHEAVNEREEEVESRPQGEFMGQVELGTELLGPAYSTRGRYLDEDGEAVEEVRIFAVHPAGDRLLHMTYRYPASPGQTRARLEDQAFVAFGYIEPLEGAEEGGDGGDVEGGPEAAPEEGADTP